MTGVASGNGTSWSNLSFPLGSFGRGVVKSIFAASSSVSSPPFPGMKEFTFPTIEGLRRQTLFIFQDEIHIPVSCDSLASTETKGSSFSV
ncbi:hypothetical protein M758_1G222700 [Ceratodon purpureus]|nr:hypothetical protein M758_1G222700 [Ceratodon purpureus]